MPSLKYLYYFSSTQVDVIEVKRLDQLDAPISEIYKWLIIKKESDTVSEFNFKSMSKSEDKEYRNFIEGSLTFDKKEALLSLFSKEEYYLKVLGPEEVPLNTAHFIEDYIKKASHR